MALQFHRAVEHLEVWSASSNGFSCVITYESPNGPGFHGRVGPTFGFVSRGQITRTGRADGVTFFEVGRELKLS